MTALRGNFRTMPEAVRYFTAKVNLPTATWRDLERGMHARAFVVAGAMKEDLLADLRAAVDAAIVEGESLEKFRARFDDIVQRHGWPYNGGRNWRTRVIYDTNIRTALMAGKYEQLTDPDAIARIPFWEYRHHTVDHPRLEHKAWNHLVLRWDDPWWKVHYPPNGWGCRCDVAPVSARRLREMGKTGPDDAPAGVGDVPPEWQYNVGQAAWGKPIADQIMRDWKAKGAAEWKPLTPGTWEDYARPAQVPLDALPAELGAERALDPTELLAAVESAIGGAEKTYLVEASKDFKIPVRVIADTLASHIEPHRAQYLPLLDALLSDPFEVWLSFEEHQVTGEVALRMRFIRGFATGDKKTGQLAIANVRGGFFEGWSFVPAEPRYIKGQRRGQLLMPRGGP